MPRGRGLQRSYPEGEKKSNLRVGNYLYGTLTARKTYEADFESAMKDIGEYESYVPRKFNKGKCDNNIKKEMNVGFVIVSFSWQISIVNCDSGELLRLS